MSVESYTGDVWKDFCRDNMTVIDVQNVAVVKDKCDKFQAIDFVINSLYDKYCQNRRNSESQITMKYRTQVCHVISTVPGLVSLIAEFYSAGKLSCTTAAQALNNKLANDLSKHPEASLGEQKKYFYDCARGIANLYGVTVAFRKPLYTVVSSAR